MPVEHTGNQNGSPEEAEAVSELVNEILQNNGTWTERDGDEHQLSIDDIVIITPYNAQVFEIQQRLPGARVGTVDKIQGQAAPSAIYSMATSSHADAPRGMEFLYSLNRLNVATSRAKCISIIVATHQLFQAKCRTPRQIQLANAFCRYAELAQLVTSGNRRSLTNVRFLYSTRHLRGGIFRVWVKDLVESDYRMLCNRAAADKPFDLALVIPFAGATEAINEQVMKLRLPTGSSGPVPQHLRGVVGRGL